MKSRQEILKKKEELCEKIVAIEEKVTVELARPYRDRRPRTLYFLFHEKKVWEYALMQINWVLGDLQAPENKTASL